METMNSSQPTADRIAELTDAIVQARDKAELALNRAGFKQDNDGNWISPARTTWAGSLELKDYLMIHYPHLVAKGDSLCVLAVQALMEAEDKRNNAAAQFLKSAMPSLKLTDLKVANEPGLTEALDTIEQMRHTLKSAEALVQSVTEQRDTQTYRNEFLLNMVEEMAETMRLHMGGVPGEVKASASEGDKLQAARSAMSLMQQAKRNPIATVYPAKTVVLRVTLPHIGDKPLDMELRTALLELGIEGINEEGRKTKNGAHVSLDTLIVTKEPPRSRVIWPDPAQAGFTVDRRSDPYSYQERHESLKRRADDWLLQIHIKRLAGRFYFHLLVAKASSFCMIYLCRVRRTTTGETT